MGYRKDGVYAASKTSIAIEFYYMQIQCRERIKLAPNDKNLKYAHRLKSEIVNSIARGTFDYSEFFPGSKMARKLSSLPGATITVKDFLKQYLITIKNSHARSTYLDYKNSVNNFLIPQFGSLYLTELKRAQVSAWIASRDISKKRAGNLLAPLRSILADAFADELIDKNPLYGWTPKIQNKIKESDDIDPFTPKEIEAILEAATGQVKNLFEFAFWSGCRTSELIALTWADVDFINETIRVRRAKVRDQVKTTKTATGDRFIKLLPGSLHALAKQKDHTFLLDAEIFFNPRTGEPWKGDGPIRKTAWRHVLKKAGVRYRYPYQTRHTFASLMLTAGESPAWVSKQLGHSDLSMIFKRYARYIDTNPDAGSKAVELYLNAK